MNEQDVDAMHVHIISGFSAGVTASMYTFAAWSCLKWAGKQTSCVASHKCPCSANVLQSVSLALWGKHAVTISSHEAL